MTLLEIVVGNVLVASAVAAGAWWVQRRARLPAIAHVLWVLVLVKLVTPPLFEVPLLNAASNEAPGSRSLHVSSGSESVLSDDADPAEPIDEARETRTRGTATSPVAPAGTNPVSTALPPVGTDAGEADAGAFAWTTWLLVVWAVGAAVFGLVGAFRMRRFSHLLTDARRAPITLEDRALRCARALGLSRSPEVLMVPAAISPMLFGAAPVRILWPADLTTRLSGAETDTLLLHELAHFARRDHWLRWFEVLVGALYWWCPLFWWSRRKMREAEEDCVDARVVAALAGGARTYADALLETVDFLSGAAHATPALASGVHPARTLRRRLTMILQEQVSGRLRGRGKAVLLALALAVLPVLPGRSFQEEKPGDPGDPIVATVNGKGIRAADLQDFLVRRNRSSLAQAMTNIVIAELELKRRGVKLTPKNVDDELESMLKKTGVTRGSGSVKTRYRFAARGQAAWKALFADQHDGRESSNDMLLQFFIRQITNEYEVRKLGGDPAPREGLLASVHHGPSGETAEIGMAAARKYVIDMTRPRGLVDARDQLVAATIFDVAQRRAGVAVRQEEVDQWAKDQHAKHPPPFTWPQICRIKGTTPEAETERWRRIQIWKRITKARVNDDEVEAFLNAHKDFFMGETRKVSHVFVSAIDEATGLPVTSAEKRDELRRRAQNLLEKLKEGADFAAIARSYSDDQVTAKAGGRIGTSIKAWGGRLAVPFQMAANALKEVGDLSGIVETRDGFHVLQLDELNVPTRKEPDWSQPRYAEWILDEYETKEMEKFRRALELAASVKLAPTSALMKMR
ncbi:MAG: hypothetical protein CMJ83_15045 [Planctomycetes bacterium]|nr:hypothetical protein [Planctomycetota bacterium]